MKCRRCSKNAVISDPNYCKDHFIDYFERKVRKTIKDYDLIRKKDRVFAAVSGGKDSITNLYVLSRYYNVEAIAVDEGIKGYREKTLDDLKRFCNKNRIKLNIVSFKEDFGFTLDSALKKLHDRPCTVCGAFRRYLINKHARILGATRLATGHNLDDEAQSVMINLFRNQQEISARLGPITGIVRDRLFIPRIKPLYFCTEKEVTVYTHLMDFGVGYYECPYTTESYRAAVQVLLNDYEAKNPGTKRNIIKAFLKMLPELKKRYMTEGKPNRCKNCGEPAKQELCKPCQMIEELGLLK